MFKHLVNDGINRMRLFGLDGGINTINFLVAKSYKSECMVETDLNLV